jgi:hypothetical protein
MLFIALTATICGANGWADVERFANARIDWFRKYLDLKFGVPSHDTFGRVFARLATSEFLTAMHSWVDEFGSSAGKARGSSGSETRTFVYFHAGFLRSPSSMQSYLPVSFCVSFSVLRAGFRRLVK